MKKKLKLLLNSSLIILGAASIVGATALTLTSCATSQSYDKSITKTLYAQYNSEIKEAMGNQAYYQLTKENQPKVLEVINKYLNNVTSIISQTENTFSLDASIWLRSFQYELQTKKKLVESNIRYIIVSSSDQMIMTNYSKSFQNSISSVAGSWYSSGNPKSTTTRITELNNVNTFITDVTNNLKDGLADGTTWSGVIAKHTIGSMLQMLYNQQLIDAVNSNSTDSLKNGTIVGTLFTANSSYTSWKDSNSESSELKAQVDALVNTVQKSLDNLMNFLITDYFSGIKYGNEGVTLDFSVVNTSPNEEDNGFSTTSSGATKYISGLGLSSSDLNVKDIGIGFSGTNGQLIYKALLQKHSNVIDADPAQQYNFGVSQVSDILNAMKEVANYIGNLKTTSGNEWKETYYYDQDSSGNSFGSQKKTDIVIRKSNGELDMVNFFQWLNSDQFFNGRDMREDQFPTINGTTSLLPSNGTSQSADTRTKPYKYKGYYTNTDLVASVIGYEGDKDANTTITNGDAGNLYVKYITNKLSPATIQTSNTITNTTMTNSISPEAAYIGSSHAVYQYLTYRNSVNSHIGSAFKETPHDWTLRSGTGGAAYASSGSGAADWVNKGWGGFYLDVNPYFGLQKWSMSTLTNHEAVSGHVFQFAYASAHPADSDAVSFRSTAYAEGWGLFSEWLATQLGIYGEPTKQASGSFTTVNGATQFTQSDVLTLPKFGTNSKTTDITKLEDYANGVYELPVTSSSADATTPQTANNQSYYDALQYFGFLNERQLRAMRVSVDVGLHAGVSGTFAKDTGYSLKEARDYLSSNSGLGIDDINRETKRYLEYTGQATSYYNGLVEMQSYFLRAKTLFEQKNPNSTFMSWEDPATTRSNTQDLFDLILRNNNVPMPVLTWAVDKYLNETYGQPTTSSFTNELDLSTANI